MKFQKGHKLWLGRHHTEMSKKKMSELQKERMASAKLRERISLANKGREVSEITKKRIRKAVLKQFENGMPEETKRKISASLIGHKKTKKEIELIRERQMGNKIWLGRKHSEESKRKMSESNKGRPHLNQRGENCHLWKGGITPANHKIRTSLEYKLWRGAVFERDCFTCQKCNQLGGILRAHHINNFAGNKNLRLAIDNGITLCNECHEEFHRRYGIKNNTLEQLQEFIWRE